MKTLVNILFAITFIFAFSATMFAQNFTSVSQFGGTYYGKLDGRNAKIKFEYLAYNQAFAEWTVTLTDLDRNVVMTGFAVEPRISQGGDHIINNVTVRSADGRVTKKMEKIFLHTWNTNFMTIIEDRGYPYVFARGNANKLPTPNPTTVQRFNHKNQFYGNYVGRIDGRNARLNIARTTDGKVAYTLTDTDRNVTFKATKPYISVDDARPFVMRSVVLRTDDGRKTKTIGGLHLHTWNTNYISGYTVWNDKEYGNFFVRQKATYPTAIISNPNIKNYSKLKTTKKVKATKFGTVNHSLRKK